MFGKFGALVPPKDKSVEFREGLFPKATVEKNGLPYRAKLCRAKVTIFSPGDENFARRIISPNENFARRIIFLRGAYI